MLIVLSIPMLLLLSTVTADSTTMHDDKSPQMCNELIDCLGRMKTKSAECKTLATSVIGEGASTAVTSAPADESVSASDAAAKAECKQNAKRMHAELTSLHEQKSDQYATCLRAKAVLAMPIENAKKRQRCNAALKKKNPSRRDAAEDNDDVVDNEKKTSRRKGGKGKHHRGAKTEDRQCHKEVKKMKTQCSALAKCCSVAKQCRIDSRLDAQISAKRNEMRQANQQCRSSSGSGNGDKVSSKKKHHHHHKKTTTTTMRTTTVV